MGRRITRGVSGTKTQALAGADTPFEAFPALEAMTMWLTVQNTSGSETANVYVEQNDGNLGYSRMPYLEFELMVAGEIRTRKIDLDGPALVRLNGNMTGAGGNIKYHRRMTETVP